MGEYSIKVYPNDQTQQLGWSKDEFSDAHLLLMNKLMEGDGCWQLFEKKVTAVSQLQKSWSFQSLIMQ